MEGDRRRRRGRPSVLTIVSAAAVGYGVYRLANWAWDRYIGEDDDEEENEAVQGESPMSEGISTSFSYFSRPSGMPSILSRGVQSGRDGTSQKQKGRLRRQRMTRCRDEVLKALDGFLPTLRKIIDQETSTKDATVKLKKLRAERLDIAEDTSPNQRNRNKEQELWNAIQVKLLTRMVATAYAHTILFVVLSVQVNLLGGRLLEEQMKSSSGQSQVSASSSLGADSTTSSRMDTYQSSHRDVLLHTYDHFFEKGLRFLVKAVERATLASLADEWNVMDRTSLHLTKNQMEEKINAIRTSMEYGGSLGNRSESRKRRSILRFLMPPSAHVTIDMEDELASSILDETWDLLESPVMKDAEEECLATTFDMMRDNHWGNLFASSSPDGSIQFVSKPLASVIPQLKHTSNSFFRQRNESFEEIDTTPLVNSYCSMMQALPSVLEVSDVSFN